MIVSKRSSGKGRQSSIGWTFLPQQWPCRRATRTSAQTSRTDIVLAREAHHDVHVGALRLGHVQVDVELHVVDQDLVGVVGNDRLTVQKPGSAIMLHVLGLLSGLAWKTHSRSSREGRDDSGQSCIGWRMVRSVPNLAGDGAINSPPAAPSSRTFLPFKHVSAFSSRYVAKTRAAFHRCWPSERTSSGRARAGGQSKCTDTEGLVGADAPQSGCSPTSRIDSSCQSAAGSSAGRV